MKNDSAIIDISRTLEPSLAVWPGDTPFSLESMLRISEGASVNLTTLTLSSHTGAHADAPYHFAEAGATIDVVDLTPYWGRAQVVTVVKDQGALLPADFSHVDLQRTPRLLVRSAASLADTTVFPSAFVYPSPQLAAHLAQYGIVLYGADAPSMDDADSITLPGHHALLAAGIAILEGLNLSAVSDGVYELVALPLKIAGGDGSPVRAALRPWGWQGS